MHIRRPVFSVLLVVLLAPETALSQYSVPAETANTERIGSARSKGQKNLLRSSGGEIGASLNFVTSDPSLNGRKLEFTDLVLLRIHGLVSFRGRFELFGGVDIVPKQPSDTDELIWQGALLGGRIKLADSFALWLRGQTGPQLDRDGYWLTADWAVQYKRALHEVMFMETAVGSTYTQLFYDQDVDRTFWLAEIFSQLSLALREPKGHFSAWITFSFHFPVIGRPKASNPDPISGLSLDPQTRVGFSLGGLVALSKTLDIFVEWSILDRGDLFDSTTTLPILNGGFDQQQLVFGFMRRFGGGSKQKQPVRRPEPMQPLPTVEQAQ